MADLAWAIHVSSHRWQLEYLTPRCDHLSLIIEYHVIDYFQIGPHSWSALTLPFHFNRMYHLSFQFVRYSYIWTCLFLLYGLGSSLSFISTSLQIV